jgi:hypothetical protein
MTSKNNDNFDPLDNLKTLLNNTTDNNESVTSENKETTGDPITVIKSIANNTLIKLESFMVIYDNDKENIYKSMVILRNKNGVLSALTGTNLQALTEAESEWTVNFSINSENVLITFNTNGDSAKIRILFNQYSVETN